VVGLQAVAAAVAVEVDFQVEVAVNRSTLYSQVVVNI
jgi:hypothetical protein